MQNNDDESTTAPKNQLVEHDFVVRFVKKLDSIENQLYEPNSVTENNTEGKKKQASRAEFCLAEQNSARQADGLVGYLEAK